MAFKDLTKSLWNKSEKVLSILGGTHSIMEMIAPVVKERVEEIKKENPRGDYLRVLLMLDEDKARELRNKIKQATQSGMWENDVIVALGNMIPKVDGEIDKARAQKIYTQMAETDDATFQQDVNSMIHDPFAQKVKWFLAQGKEAVEATLLMAAFLHGKYDQQLQDWVAEKKTKRGRFGRLAHRIFPA